MILAPPFLRVVEHVDRRVLGAFQFVDAVTQLPVNAAAQIEVTGAALVGGADVPFLKESVRLRQTRSGFWAITRAPFFDRYAETLEDPETPDEVKNNSLRLRVAVADAGPHYLPQEFQFDLPRSLDHDIFEPLRVQLFRAPGAPVLGGWAVLRVRVSTADANPVGGVLVRIFRHPRQAGASAIGQGMTEWRGRLRGEALVAVANIPRFRPGEANEVLARTQDIHIEVVQDSNFTGATANQLPDAPKIVTGTASEIVIRRSDSPQNPLGVVPAAPLKVRAGQEATIELTMP